MNFLKMCCDIFAGHHFKKAIDISENSYFKVIQIKNILSNGLIDWSSVDSVLMDDVLPRKLILKPGDLIINAKGARRAVAKIDETVSQTYTFFTTSNFFVLRPHEQIQPDFLHWWLMQEPVQTFLDEQLLGLGTPNLKRVTLEQVPLPKLDASQQQDIALLHQQQLEQLALIEAITKKNTEININLATNLFDVRA